MEAYTKLVIVAMVLVASIGNEPAVEAIGQTICGISFDSLMSCKPAVTGPSPAQPSLTCCSALSNADLQCLCSYKNSKLLPSFGIDPNLAIWAFDFLKIV
ncbi:hypothetical protein F0562_028611 [Nyssa sinensis]|uniref:Bifunctional inhibitor/plant lipid transfer protein/seed storage helical domain-containing protein n=1 Tax=Nyssa sinensis TaxID=561372 RepID=A0A5J5AYP0_9ASTE|nr:hypothetical protein F0562_028611 [Nyssa sinensis]